MITVLHKLQIVDLLVFIVGAALGFVSMSRVIKFLLENYKSATVAGLIGIMLGSLRVPMNQVIGVDSSQYLICLVIGIIGMIIVLFIETKFEYELI